MKEEGKEVAMQVEGLVKDATTKPKTDKEIKKEEQEMRHKMAILQKQAAMELAEYKKRLRESVELKRLQVEEIQLNLQYFEYRKQLAKVEEEMAEMEAVEKAKAQEAQAKIIPIKKGKVKTEAEIAEAKSTMEEIHGK